MFCPGHNCFSKKFKGSCLDCQLYPVYTMKQAWSKDKANVFNIHVHNVCSKYASCLLHTDLCFMIVSCLVPSGLFDESFMFAWCLLHHVNEVLATFTQNRESLALTILDLLADNAKRSSAHKKIQGVVYGLSMVTCTISSQLFGVICI